MKLKEVLNVLPKYNDGSGYDINLKNTNIPAYHFNNLNMYDYEEGKQNIEKYLNSEVTEIRNGEDQILIYIDYKLN